MNYTPLKIGRIEDSVRAIRAAERWDELEKIFPEERRQRNKYEFVLYIGSLYALMEPKSTTRITNSPQPVASQFMLSAGLLFIEK